MTLLAPSTASKVRSIFDDQLAPQVEIRLRCGRESHLDFLETHFHQHLEELELGIDAHRLDQRLVAVTQIGAHPDGRFFDRARRPATAIETDLRERTVFLGGVRHRDRRSLFGRFS